MGMKATPNLAVLVPIITVLVVGYPARVWGLEVGYPVPRYVAGSYEGRTFYYDRVHLGEDEKLPEGTPIRSIADGRIVQYEGHAKFGTLVAVIEHDLGDPLTLNLAEGDHKTVTLTHFCSIYGHLRRSAERDGRGDTGLSLGARVNKGDIIGYVQADVVVNGQDLNGDGAEHLHMGIRLGPHPGRWVYYGYSNPSLPESSVANFASAREMIEQISKGAGTVQAVLLVLDVSGSMGNTMPSGQRKVDALKVAVRGFLKTVDDDVRFNGASYRIGAITFSDTPSKLCDFTRDTDSVRNAIAGLEPQQSTNFGDSFEMAISMLGQAGGDEKTIVFFSDGKTNAGSIPRDDFLIDFDPTTSPRSDIFRDERIRDLYWRANQAKIRVITVGFGDPGRSSSLQKYIWLPGVEPDLDDEVLRKLAETPKTGGRYVNAEDYAGLLKSFVVAYNIGSGRQLVYETTGTIGQGETQQLLFDASTKPTQTAAGRWLTRVASLDLLCTPAEADGTGQLLVTLGWDVGKLVLSLRDPTGMEVTTAYPGAHISMGESPINVFIGDPKRGKWSATILAEDAAGGTVNYYFLASSQLPPIPAGGGGAGSGADWQDAALWVVLSCIAVLSIMVAVVAVRRHASVGPHGPPGRLMLQVQSKGEPPGNFAVAGSVIRIGRGPANDIVLTDPKVSGRHAELRLRGGQVVVIDAGSRNGTWVGGERVTARAVRPGEAIRIGDTMVVVLGQ